MTHAMRTYYDYFRIEHGSRTEPAVITFDDDGMTADVRILPPDNRPHWAKAGFATREAWLDTDPYTQAYREAKRMSTSPGPILDPEAFEHWKKLIRNIKKGEGDE